ncbi:hypothetical protein DPEC_G00033010 [Dallia pectoralis]|uniref:Uncharacterized protein n=1 Tax=Dallia pectoralis TaxID=75939 RepID=A0ACC2HE42_DALPE|nr:hypothetical protein DPEC_G00033010 [Dallia pectoralis]
MTTVQLTDKKQRHLSGNRKTLKHIEAHSESFPGGLWSAFTYGRLRELASWKWKLYAEFAVDVETFSGPSQLLNVTRQ